MGPITQINVRPAILLEVLSMAVLHCRREMSDLFDDVDAVPQDVDDYRRLIRVMDIALDILEAVGDFDSNEFVQISGTGKHCHDGVTLERREGQEDDA